MIVQAHGDERRGERFSGPINRSTLGDPGVRSQVGPVAK